MKNRVTTWFKGLSNSGKVITAASLFAVVGIMGAAASPVEETTKTVVQNEQIAYETTYEEDENLLVSESKVISAGVLGEKAVTYQITYRGDEEKERRQLSVKVLKEPVSEVKAKGVREVNTITTTEEIPFTTSTKSDATLSKGTRKTITAGVNGRQTTVYKVTTVRGFEVSREQISSEVTTKPVSELVAVGTKSASSTASCDPNYAGACVPIASDVDCGGGSGNGPAYLYGTARVVGSDIYGLDRDGDGLACE